MAQRPHFEAILKALRPDTRHINLDLVLVLQRNRVAKGMHEAEIFRAE
jgi:hypothetical protein